VAGGGVQWEVIVEGVWSSVLEDEKSSQMDGGDSCTTVWIYLVPLNCTFKMATCKKIT
jgi:hypothetical protein